MAYAASQSSPPVNDEWKLIFNDDFNSFDSRFWSEGFGKQANRSLNGGSYLRAANLNYQNGQLQLNNTYNPHKEYTYAGAGLNSANKFTFRYGYLETAVKPALAKGIDTAFWLMQAKSNLARVNQRFEIDIFEQLSKWKYKRYSASVHAYQAEGMHKRVCHSKFKAKKVDKDDWVRYGLLWEPGYLAWFINGEKVHEYFDKANEIDSAMYIIFQLSLVRNGLARLKDKKLPIKLALIMLGFGRRRAINVFS